MNTGRRWLRRLRKKGYNKCPECGGFGYIKFLNDSDDIVDMECPLCRGYSIIKTREDKDGTQ